MNIQNLLKSFGLFSLPLVALSSCQKNKPQKENTEQPNIVFFIADDMYPDMFNCLTHRNDLYLTPNIDKLAAEGVVMTNQYCVSPVSTASRYNTLTGKYASRATNSKMINFTKQMDGQVVVQWNSFITPKDKTLGNYMQELGYKTGFVGKNHVVEDPGVRDQDTPLPPDMLNRNPLDPAVKKQLEDDQIRLQNCIKAVGFDYASNLYYDNPDWLMIKALNSQNQDWITEGGLNFIEKYKNDPFFLYFATTIPHSPNEPERSWDADPRITAVGILDKELHVQPSRASIKHRIDSAGVKGKYKENVLWLDDALGALIKKLKKTGKLDNTIIFFFNDQGQSAKGTLYEGGIRTQCIVWRSKGFKCGHTCDAQVTNVDFLPTILELCGRKDTVKGIDGISFAKVLNGQKSQKRQTMYFELGYARAVVKGNYKYLALRYPKWAMDYTPEQRKKMLNDYSKWRESFGNEKITDDYTLPYGHLEMFPGGGGAEHEVYGSKPGFFDPDQLYDLSKDPQEMHNLAKDPAFQKTLNDLKSELRKYTSSLPGKFNI